MIFNIISSKLIISCNNIPYKINYYIFIFLYEIYNLFLDLSHEVFHEVAVLQNNNVNDDLFMRKFTNNGLINEKHLK